MCFLATAFFSTSTDEKLCQIRKEEAARAELFKLVDINHNGMVSLAEIDKAPLLDSGPGPLGPAEPFEFFCRLRREALPEVMGCTALFNVRSSASCIMKALHARSSF